MAPNHLRRGVWAVDTYTGSVWCADEAEAHKIAGNLQPYHRDVWIVTPAGVPRLWRG